MNITTNLPRTGLLAALFAVCMVACGTSAAADDYHGVPPPAPAPATVAAMTATCTACHGANGTSALPIYPNLAGQQFNYLLKQLEEFRSGKRPSAIMRGMAMTIPPSQDHKNLREIAAYFAHMQRSPASQVAPPATSKSLALGKSIFTSGLAKDHIPACSACHGLAGEGNGPMAVPALAHQHAGYLVTQLDQFASGARANDPGDVMGVIARAMSEQQRKAVAAYANMLDQQRVLGTGPKTYAAYAANHRGAPTGATADQGSTR